ncbi:hypothetical protein V2J09_015840 [Rumex salicifolius]
MDLEYVQFSVGPIRPKRAAKPVYIYSRLVFFVPFIKRYLLLKSIQSSLLLHCTTLLPHANHRRFANLRRFRSPTTVFPRSICKTSQPSPSLFRRDREANNKNTTPLKGKPGWSNRLLAGYMAHEFLTQGTLLGQIFDPARAEAVPVSTPAPSRDKTYGEVSCLVKAEGAHIPGIVNPTQLARWIGGHVAGSDWKDR